MKIKYLFVVGILYGLSFTGIAQSNFSLEEAISYAIQNNYQVKLSMLDIAEAEQQVKEYWAIGIPKINGYMDYSYYFDIPTQIIPDFITPTIDNRLIDYETHTEKVGILDSPDKTLPLPPGSEGVPAQFGTTNNVAWGLDMETLLFDGSFLVGLKGQKIYKEQVAKKAELTERDVRVAVIQAYVNVLIAQANLDIVRNDIENINKILEETEATYEEGFLEELDVDRLRLSQSTLIRTRDNLTRLIDVSKNVLKYHMNFPMNQDVALTSSLETLLVDQSPLRPEQTQFEFNDRLEYQILEMGEDLNDVNVKRFQATFLPSLFGFASYGRNLQTNQLFNSGAKWYPTTIAGVGLQLPIYTGGDRSAKIQKAKIGLDRVRTQMKDFEASMQIEVDNAAIAYENARLTVEQNKYSLDISQKIFNTILIKYREGLASSLEVNQAETDLYRSQGNYTTSLFDLLNARIDLEKALGTI